MTTSTTTPSAGASSEEWTGPDPFEAPLGIQEASQAAQRIEQAKNQIEADKAAELAAIAKRRASKFGNAVAVAVSFALLAGTGAAFGNAFAEHADEEVEQNIEWSNEDQQNQLQQDFENGIMSESETNLPSTPSPSDLPSPTFLTGDEVQAPTIPSPDQE